MDILVLFTLDIIILDKYTFGNFFVDISFWIFWHVLDLSIWALFTLQTLGTQESKQHQLSVEVDAVTRSTLSSFQQLSEEQNKDPQIELILRDNTFKLTSSRITWGQDRTPIYCNLKFELLFRAQRRITVLCRPTLTSLCRPCKGIFILHAKLKKSFFI